MNMMTMDSDSLSALIGEEVPDMFVVIAKNALVGLDSKTIADLLGVDVSEVDSIQQDEIYKSVRLLLGAEHAKSMVETDMGYDSLEKFALNNLLKRIQTDRDPEFNLRVAAMANKATRRIVQNKNNVLDPSLGGAQIPLQLSKRVVQRINSDGSREQEVTHSISLKDGTAVNPSFNDIDSLLGVSSKPKIVAPTARLDDDDFNIDDIVLKRK
jgi:hypothetical protein